MDEQGATTAVTGLVVGALVALGSPSSSTCCPTYCFSRGGGGPSYLAGALAAPPPCGSCNGLPGAPSGSARDLHLGSRRGVLFDSLASDSCPASTATGQALAWVASALIFAFASLIIAGR